jgi:hypothetical protein
MAEEPAAEIIQLFRSSRSDLVAEGLRLIRAFMQISDPVLRDALVAFAEQMAKPQSTSSRERSS